MFLAKITSVKRTWFDSIIYQSAMLLGNELPPFFCGELLRMNTIKKQGN